MKKFFSALLVFLMVLNCSVFTIYGSSGWYISDDGIITGCNVSQIATTEGGKTVIIIPYSIGGTKIVG